MKEITVPAKPEKITAVTAWADEQLEALDCPMKAQMQLDVAIDELFGNIAHYAYGETEDEATVRFGFDEAVRVVSITFMDRGVPFNPLEKADPDVTLSAEEREIGGLGIFMVRKTTDKMEYRHENGFNILTIYKQI